MATKRTSAVSILAAFVLIASFLAALLPQTISPQSVQADTTVTVYTAVGTTNWTCPNGVTSVEVLVVGGGGAGGGSTVTYQCGGGGGAGGVRYNASYPVSAGTSYTVTVGSGGTGDSGQGNDGGSSVFGTITAAGGGGGGDRDSAGNDGGSGGGGGLETTGEKAGGSGNTPSTSPSQGNNGARSFYDYTLIPLVYWRSGGGGGGAGAVGTEGTKTVAPNGGAGVNTYSDLLILANVGQDIGGVHWIGGGGGGGTAAASPQSSGGNGGGGGGGDFDTGSCIKDGCDATPNTGGGGGGAYSGGSSQVGGDGGSGVVIIKYVTNDPPTIGTVALWTTGGSPAETTSMTPQVEYNIKVPMTEDDTLDDLVDIIVTLYYDADGTYSESEVPTAGNNQRNAILTWENGGSPAWTIETGSDTSWTIETSNCVEPTLSNTTGTFEFHFKPGKVATRTTGDAKWHIYVLATDSVDNTDTGTKQNLTMNWYGEIIVNTASVDWGEVSPGLEFADSSPSRESDISVTYISNGAYDQQIKSSATWTDGGSNTATLNTDGTPGANEFSLKADNDNTIDGAILVTGSYATFNSITYAFSKALDFDGSNNKVTTSSTVPTNTFTFEAWVKAVNEHEIDAESDSSTTGTSGQCYVFGAAHRDTDGGAGLSVGTNGISVYEHGSGYMPPLAVYSGSLGTGWNHIAVVYNNKQPSIYLNGNLVRTGLTSPKTTVYAPYEIGLGSYGGFEGLIDEVRVWDVARTQQQIRDNMYSELPDPTSEADLTGYWKFNSDALDSSGNDNNGSLSDPAPDYVDNTLTGTTAEDGNTEASNSLWLSIGTPFTKATYSGIIYYQIAD